MSFPFLELYLRTVLSYVPLTHWALMGVVALALAVVLMIWKKVTTYGAICIYLTIFTGLFLLDTAIVIRFCGIMPHATGIHLGFELDRLLFGTNQARVETLVNIAVFIPFSLFLSELQFANQNRIAYRQIWISTLAAFVLSLIIECLQWVLKVGYFELTDLALNTIGGGIGAYLAYVARLSWNKMRKKATVF